MADGDISLAALTKRDRILASGIDVFCRYGFKRASMADIAEAAEMSRPALYQHFRNKAEIFRAGSAFAQAAALKAARAVADDPAEMTLAARLGAMLIAYKSAAWRIVVATPHGEEMVGLNAALAEDVTEAAAAEAAALFTTVIARAAAPGWRTEEAARLLIASAWAAARGSADEAAFTAAMRALADIWAAALTTHRP